MSELLERLFGAANAKDFAKTMKEVQEHFESEVNSHLHGLARYEMPKKIGLLAEPFTIEDGSLTPTQKVKRNVVAERQAELIEAFYDPANEDRNVFAGS